MAEARDKQSSFRLFPPMERTDSGPADRLEPRYSYLQRSARRSFAAVRALLEEWFGRYPQEHQAELHARLVSGDDTSFDSAFFELYLHELLTRQRLSVQVHPSSPDPTSNRAPDFLCESDQGSFYVEAVVSAEQSREAAAADKRLKAVFDALNELDSPDFFVGARYTGMPDSPPPAGRIRDAVQSGLSDLDPDDPLFARLDLDAGPRWRFSHDGLELEVFPIPKKPEARGTTRQPLGFIMPLNVSRRADDERLQKALKGKAGRYGRLRAPYVVAVNAQFLHLDRIDVMQALYGKEVFFIDSQDPAGELRMEREPDGLWTSRSGPRNTRVSAALVVEHVLPWSVHAAGMRLYRNPWAKHMLPGCLDAFPRAEPMGEKVSWIEGADPTELLGISPNWLDEEE